MKKRGPISRKHPGHGNDDLIVAIADDWPSRTSGKADQTKTISVFSSSIRASPSQVLVRANCGKTSNMAGMAQYENSYLETKVTVKSDETTMFKYLLTVVPFGNLPYLTMDCMCSCSCLATERLIVMLISCTRGYFPTSETTEHGRRFKYHQLKAMCYPPTTRACCCVPEMITYCRRVGQMPFSIWLSSATSWSTWLLSLFCV